MKKCTKELAVRVALKGGTRGIISCPVCKFGHSPYDVVKQPQKYKEILEKISKEEPAPQEKKHWNNEPCDNTDCEMCNPKEDVIEELVKEFNIIYLAEFRWVGRRIDNLSAGDWLQNQIKLLVKQEIKKVREEGYKKCLDYYGFSK